MSERQSKDYQKRILTIPNALSLFRILLIPILVYLYCARADYLWATLVLLLSGITDVVDGIIARKFHMISDFGKVFDPAADKLTQMAMLACLVTRFPYMLVPLCLLIVKEIFAGITGLLTIKRTGQVLGAVWHGKATTVAIYAMMALHLTWYDIPPTLSYLSVGLCSVIMLFSATMYGIRNIRIILTPRTKSKEK